MRLGLVSSVECESASQNRESGAEFGQKRGSSSAAMPKRYFDTRDWSMGPYGEQMKGYKMLYEWDARVRYPVVNGEQCARGIFWGKGIPETIATEITRCNLVSVDERVCRRGVRIKCPGEI